MVMAMLRMLSAARWAAMWIGLLLGLMGTALAGAPLAPDDAFHLSASRTVDGTLTLAWRIAPGTYLYRDSLTAQANGSSVPLETSPGEPKDDPNFGMVEVYHARAEATAPGLPEHGLLRVAFQGCAEAGICYPQIVRTVDLTTLGVAAPDATSASIGKAKVPFGAPRVSPMERWDPGVAPRVKDAADASTDGAGTLFQGGLPGLMASFLGFGLLLAFTPCVFPMLPILSGILAGGGTPPSMARGTLLASSYGLAMAAAYGVLGIAAGWSGANLQVALQTPWALGAMAMVFGVLAISMFGKLELALPAGRLGLPIRTGGSLTGAAALGFASALVVGPCVTPPLAAAILYAAQSGDMLRGGAALFMLGLGMALPLVVVGAFGAHILPRSGAWMVAVRHTCGALFLGIAVLLAGRLIPAAASLAIWGALAIGLGVFLGAFDRPRRAAPSRLAKALGLLAVIYGGTLVVGAAAGGTDPLRPLGVLSAAAGADRPALAETRVSSLGNFRQVLAEVGVDGHPTLVSFTADWCTVCKSNAAVMAEPEVRARIARLSHIIADVTAYGADTQALMARFDVVGPPTLFLVDAKGQEIAGSRLTGVVSSDDIERLAARAGL
ncbi:protein-disulfide reductase DsbD [Ancylobacter mangrovi]|uniref:protein-disulfide reductase DsbD n=1 Tax=Ancylobacter mangrovi TaxID=2972472 RepID=UPI002161DDB7|nr:protein-disulfide reductase DsbD [Ancylobacter mangrovi]MCS0505196.1 protein-disulfide reductase DsbD [Ancylobacter mangrovi]